MLLHQTPYAMALNLGTRDQPIHIDFSSYELRHPQSPEFSVASTSLPQRPLPTHVPRKSQAKPRNTSRKKAKTVLSPFVTPSVRNESLVAEPMTTHSQDVAPSLKRKRVNAEEDPDADLAKRLRKSEKKRRKRERRAARFQLNTNALHYPSTPANFDQLGPSHPSLDSLPRGPPLPDVPLATTKPRPGCSTWPHISISSHGSHCQQDQSETGPGEETFGLSGSRLFSSARSQIPLPTSVLSAPARDSPPSFADEDTPDSLPHQVASVTKTPTPQSVPTSTSLLNLRIKERMALLIEHQRLANSAESLPPAPLHRSTNYTASKLVVDETITAKQNTLDQAISENKAALAQLGAPLSKEEKLALMKAVTQRNKLITQLTNEIKTHLDSVRSRMVAAPIPSLPESSVMRFKWPETEFPLYLIISTDDEDSNSLR